jgi:hypothetical protein
MAMVKIQVLFAALAGLIAVSTPGAALADCSHSSGGKCVGIVERIWTYTDGTNNYVLIDPEGADTTGLTCNRQTSGTLAGIYVRLNLSNEAMRAAFSALLAAYLAGETVEIRTNTDSGTQCTVTAFTLL